MLAATPASTALATLQAGATRSCSGLGCKTSTRRQMRLSPGWKVRHDGERGRGRAATAELRKSGPRKGQHTAALEGLAPNRSEENVLRSSAGVSETERPGRPLIPR